MIRQPTPIDTNVVIKPESWNEWFITYFPIFVVPVRSKFIAATSVGQFGMKKYPFTAGNIATRASGLIPSPIPKG